MFKYLTVPGETSPTATRQNQCSFMQSSQHVQHLLPQPLLLKTSQNKHSLKTRPAVPKTRTYPRHLHTLRQKVGMIMKKLLNYTSFLKGCFLNFLPYSPISASFFHFILNLVICLWEQFHRQSLHLPAAFVLLHPSTCHLGRMVSATTCWVQREGVWVCPLCVCRDGLEVRVWGKSLKKALIEDPSQWLMMCFKWVSWMNPTLWYSWLYNHGSSPVYKYGKISENAK